jgi:hypothetical protein
VAAYHNRQPAQIERFLDPIVQTYSPATYLATSWLVMMDRYLELFAEKIMPLAVRYEDLNIHREAVLTAIFDYCGLPITMVERALKAFERDSQQGTVLARDDTQKGNTVKLTNEITTQIQAILNRHPTIHKPDFILPGTLKVH